MQASTHILCPELPGVEVEEYYAWWLVGCVGIRGTRLGWGGGGGGWWVVGHVFVDGKIVGVVMVGLVALMDSRTC